MSFGSWSVLTTNYLFILYAALCGITFCSLLHLANGQWRVHVRYIASSLGVLLGFAFVLLLILLFNAEKTFVWMAHAHDGEHHLNGWHDKTFLIARQIIGFLVVAGMYLLFVKYQHASATSDDAKVKRTFRNIALLIPFFYVIYGSMVAWDFEMTMVPGWHSASYAPYFFVSNFHGFLGFFALLLFALDRSGKLTVKRDGAVVNSMPPFILNHIAQMMLAFTILWTYFFFTQYLIMWYGRFPEEIGRFWNMMYHDIGILFWGFLALKFVMPFCSLIFTNNRHDPAAIALIGTGIMLGTWMERYTWISGSKYGEYHLPFSSMFDWLATILVFLAAFWLVRMTMRKYGLLRA